MSQRREWDREQEPAAAWSVLSDRLTGLRANPETNYALYSEISPRFLGLMVAAMMVSFHKYGKVEDAYPERVNAIDSLKLRLDKYAQTGNVEYLVDVANQAMIEFMCPAHPAAFFKATNSSGSPGRVAQDGETYTAPNQKANLDIMPPQPCGPPTEPKKDGDDT